MEVLLVATSTNLPDDANSFLQSAGYDVDIAPDYSVAISKANQREYDAIVMPSPPAGKHLSDDYRELMRLIGIQGTAAVVLDSSSQPGGLLNNWHINYAPEKITKEELHGRLSTINRFHNGVLAMEHELRNMQSLFRQLNIQFTEVDQEMRLAGRLQGHFLPRKIEGIEPVTFSALYRPASFVSGDIYDITRVDEEHVAFYVADAVGHGMAASLLTMFIKNAVVSKRIEHEGYEILDPDQTLRHLNETLLAQMLPNNQFVTLCYALFNVKTMELQWSRGGHPYPLHCTANGHVSELKSQGGLLGLFPGEDFPTEKIIMKPGEKLILYTDGMEVAFAPGEDRENELSFYHTVISDLAHLPAKRLVAELDQALNAESGSLNPKDDVTVLVMEVSE